MNTIGNNYHESSPCGGRFCLDNGAGGKAMNIRDLDYVVAVAEERHFGRAAGRCNVSQPALSGQIRKLEDELGVELFERSKRHVMVTPVGEQIVALARELIDTAGRIGMTAAAARDPMAGPLRIGMIHTIGPYLSPIILPAIGRELPNVSVALTEASTEELEGRLLDGSIDVAITATTPEDPGLEELILYAESFEVVLPAGHPLARKKSLGISDLMTGDLLLLTEGHCLRDQVLDACHLRPAAAAPNTRETSLETIIAMVAAGQGITMVPRMCKRALSGRSGGSVGIAFRQTASPVGRTVRLVYRKSFTRHALVERLGELMLAEAPAA